MELEGSFETSFSTPNQKPGIYRMNNTRLAMRLLNCTTHITFVMSKYSSSSGQLYQVQTMFYLQNISVRVSWV
jgi:hypothetical protein